MEAGGLGLFMVSACGWGTLLEYPGSPVRRAVADPDLRRLLMGLLMGLTAVALIYSPWGKRSGAHLNPSVTLAFLRLGKVAPWDGAFYIAAQFAGGILGVGLAALVLGQTLADPAVNYVVTAPGPRGASVAFAAEAAISFGLMIAVLVASNTERLARLTGVVAGTLVAVYIAVEAPLSGMSMNPARTVGSAVPANVWSALWVYFAAPILGMLLAAEAYRRLRGAQNVICAKLHHHNNARCIFRCGYREGVARPSAGTSGAGPDERRPSPRSCQPARGDADGDPVQAPASVVLGEARMDRPVAVQASR